MGRTRASMHVLSWRKQKRPLAWQTKIGPAFVRGIAAALFANTGEGKRWRLRGVCRARRRRGEHGGVVNLGSRLDCVLCVFRLAGTLR